MMKSSELFGKIPKWIWKVQHKLALWRIASAKQQLALQHAKTLEMRDMYLERKIYEAIVFWEILRNEAVEGMT